MHKYLYFIISVCGEKFNLKSKIIPKSLKWGKIDNLEIRQYFEINEVCSFFLNKKNKICFPN